MCSKWMYTHRITNHYVENQPRRTVTVPWSTNNQFVPFNGRNKFIIGGAGRQNDPRHYRSMCAQAWQTSRGLDLDVWQVDCICIYPLREHSKKWDFFWRLDAWLPVYFSLDTQLQRSDLFVFFFSSLLAPLIIEDFDVQLRCHKSRGSLISS